MPAGRYFSTCLMAVTCLAISISCSRTKQMSAPLPPAQESGPKSTFPPPAGLIDVRTLVPDIILDIRYASADNFMGMPLDGYLSPRAFLMPQTAEALKSAQKDFISFGYCLKLYDAYRPVRAERHMIRWAKATNNTSLLREGYLPFSLSPYRSYGHACGNAVDVTLVDKNGRELDMGTTFDAFTRASWTMNAKGFILKNRLLLKSVMEHHGFTNFAREWWHYNFKSESGTPHDDVIR